MAREKTSKLNWKSFFTGLGIGAVTVGVAIKCKKDCQISQLNKIIDKDRHELGKLAYWAAKNKKII